MIIPDVNLLIYAYSPDSPFHDRAAAWWTDCLSGGETVGLSHLCVFGFLRITTNRAIFCDAFSLGDAAAHVRSWLSRPNTRIIEPDPDHIDRVVSLLEEVGVAGKIVTDAQFAALAIEQGAVLHTADADFGRFRQLKWINPLMGVSRG